MTPESSVGLIAVIAVWAWKPGPGHLMLISRYVADGAVATIAMMAGMALAQSVFVILAMTGFDAIGPDHPIARGIQVIAACMLVVTALRALLCHAQNAPDRGPSTRPRARLFPFMAGLSLSLTNPMNIAFYAAVLPTFAVSADPAAIAFVAVLVLTALTFGDLMYLLIAHRCRAFLTTPRRYAPVAGAANAIFLMVGLWILTKSAGLL